MTHNTGYLKWCAARTGLTGIDLKTGSNICYNENVYAVREIEERDHGPAVLVRG